MRGGTVRYDVEADWQLLNTCNYRCAYCFHSDEALGEKLKKYAEPEVWGRAFDQTRLRWLVHMTGGEPSAYPGFPELCKYLTQRHLISINSNMTGWPWESFAQQIDPDTVTFINAGLHLSERQRKNGAASFLKNVELLSDRKFPVFTSLVMTPDALARFDEAKELLGTIGMFPIPKAVRGKFEEKWYPLAYTAGERKLFRSYSRLARDFYAYALAKLPERPTVDVFSDDSILLGEPSFRDLSCEAGRLFFKIEPNGDVFRCGPSKSYGNILKGTFIRNDGPMPCDNHYCFYFCQKYSESRSLQRTLNHSLADMPIERRNVRSRGQSGHLETSPYIVG
jgi:MoaA/NifB/PqqE/SkfB family radical SAM enzyme